MRIDVREDREHASCATRIDELDAGERTLADRARDDHGMGDLGDIGIGRVGRGAGDLLVCIDPVDRAADAGLHLDPPATRLSARAMTRRASSTLNALSGRGSAFASASFAASANVSGVAGLPTSAVSTAGSRQGLVPTPPSATRASLIVPPWTSSATAADASANAYDARSRTLTYRDFAATGVVGISIAVTSSPGWITDSTFGWSSGTVWNSTSLTVRSPARDLRWTTASSAASAPHISDGCAALLSRDVPPPA